MFVSDTFYYSLSKNYIDRARMNNNKSDSVKSVCHINILQFR